MTTTPVQPPPPVPATTAGPKNRVGLAALIVGIIGTVCAVVPFLSYGAWLLGLAAIVLGIVGAVKAATPKAAAVTGIVLGAIALILSIVLSIVYTAGFVLAAASEGLESIDTRASSAAPQDEDGAAADPSADAASETAVFGDTFTYEDGLAITVEDQGEFTPSEYAFAGEADRFEKFTITVENGTAEVFDPAIISATLQAGDAEAEQVFDSAKGFNGGPSTTLLAGRSVKWKIGFGVASDDLVLQVRPDFEHEDAIFTSD